MESKKSIFFGGLNELRAIAALAVIFHHIELFKHRDNIVSLFDWKCTAYFIEHLGKNGVYLFFVLSGFLITYLLITERTKNNSIDFKKFYLRRVFRIWPLYYIIFGISIFLIPLIAGSSDIFSLTSSYFSRIQNPSNYDLKTILLYIFFLPNLALKLGKVLVGASQSWSVGVEEQFYILWPLIVAFFKRKILPFIFGVILIIFILINLQFPKSTLGFIANVIPFEFMAIGAIGGYYYSEYKEIITRYTKSRAIYFVILLLIGIFAFVPIFNLYLQNIISGFIFLLLILTSINQSNRSIFRNHFFSFLGNISYGIYMYHPFVMFLVFPVSYKLLQLYDNIFIFHIFIYLFVPCITIFISYFSFKYIEKFFIKIKDSKFKTL